jgi:hypothetical protein
VLHLGTGIVTPVLFYYFVISSQPTHFITIETQENSIGVRSICTKMNLIENWGIRRDNEEEGRWKELHMKYRVSPCHLSTVQRQTFYNGI